MFIKESVKSNVDMSKIADAIDAISQPTAEEGYWDFGSGWPTCSKCREKARFVEIPFNYCPNCGRKMKVK